MRIVDASGPLSPASRHAGAAAFSLVILSWASMPLFLKYLTGYLDGWTVNGLRYTVSILLWTPFILIQIKRGAWVRSLWRDAWIPACGHAFGQVCWGLAPYHNDASIMHFIGRSTFLFMIVFSFLFLHEERKLIARPIFWLGVAGTVAGVLLMYFGGASHGGTSLTGVLLLLGAGAGWATYGVAVRRNMGYYSAPVTFGAISLYSAPVLLIMMFGLGDWRAAADLPLPAWGWLTLSAVTGITLAHVLLYVVIRRYGPIVSDGVFQLIPFLSVLGASLLFGERMSGLQWTGGLVMVGAAYALLAAKREARMQELSAMEREAGGAME